MPNANSITRILPFSEMYIWDFVNESPKNTKTPSCVRPEREILLLQSGLFWFSAVDEDFFWGEKSEIRRYANDRCWIMKHAKLVGEKAYIFFFTAFSDQMARKCLGHFACIAISFAFNVTVDETVMSNPPNGQCVSFQRLCVCGAYPSHLGQIRNPPSIFARCRSTR